MLTLETLQEIHGEIIDSIQRLEDEMEQFDKYREEQFEDEDIDSVLLSKKELLAKIERAMVDFVDTSLDKWEVLEDIVNDEQTTLKYSQFDTSLEKKKLDAIKIEMQIANKNIEVLAENLSMTLKDYLYDVLTESLIQSDSTCEREQSLLICEVIDIVAVY